MRKHWVARTMGYETCDSGDGVTKPAAGLTWDDGVRDHPHVVCMVEAQRMVRMASVLVQHMKEKGLPVVPIGGTASRSR